MNENKPYNEYSWTSNYTAKDGVWTLDGRAYVANCEELGLAAKAVTPADLQIDMEAKYLEWVGNQPKD